MTGRRVVLSLLLLCSLTLCAAMAPSASAENLDMVTCERIGAGNQFSDPHCAGNSGGLYAHIGIARGKTTYHGISNANTCEEETAACPLSIKATVAGTPVWLQAPGVSGSGTIAIEESGAETFTAGTETLTLEEVEVLSPPAKGCVVKGGKVVSKELKMTTLGTGSFIKFEPISGTALAEITIEGCSVPALNNTFPLAGSFKAPPVGAVVRSTLAQTTEQNTLKFAGAKAGLEAALTTSGKESVEEGWTPLSFT